MYVDRLEMNRHSVGFRRKGRPQTAPLSLRANGYRDEDGRYQLSAGLKPWHERIVDFMIANPSAKIVDIAKAFDVTPIWVGMLLKTDAFREYYDHRMQEFQGLINQRIVTKLHGIAAVALDQLHDKVTDEMNPLSFGQVKEAAELSLKALGYTAQPGPAVVSTVVNNTKVEHNTYVAVSKSAVEAARAKMKERLALEPPVSDPSQYQRVTSSMEVGVEGVEDAVLLPDSE
jgi:hypothetical protein